MCAKLVSVKYQWWKDKRDKDLDLKEILFVYLLSHVQTSLVAQTVKRLPAVWEPWVWSQGWENPLEKEMATHSSTLAWKIPWTEESGGLQSMESQRVGHDWATSLFTLILWHDSNENFRNNLAFQMSTYLFWFFLKINMNNFLCYL